MNGPCYIQNRVVTNRVVKRSGCSKIGVCRGIPIFLIFDPKHRWWVLVRTTSPRNLALIGQAVLEGKMFEYYGNMANEPLGSNCFQNH